MTPLQIFGGLLWLICLGVILGAFIAYYLTKKKDDDNNQGGSGCGINHFGYGYRSSPIEKELLATSKN